MKRGMLIAWVFGAATLVSACETSGPIVDAGDVDDVRRGTELRDGTGALGDLYFLVTRPDLKKCMWPMCGGVYVKQINSEKTVCADGSSEDDCYIAQFDFDALGLDEEEVVDLATSAKAGHSIVRGTFGAVDSPWSQVATLVASEAWIGQAETDAVGTFYGVKDSGIVCITYPCGSLTERKLNTFEIGELAGLELATTGADKGAIDAAASSLQGDGVMVVGEHQIVTGPAGDGQTLVATEFYLLAAKAAEPCGNNVCGEGEYCCNASCSMCAPEGSFCIQIACEPDPPTCAHDECEVGSAMLDGCSPCATKVCAADPYCCDNDWDSICVGEAETMCSVCETTPPEPSCEHDGCGTGDALDPTCSDCAAKVCAADSFCCDSQWDGLCATQAQQVCSECASQPDPCAHSECSKGKKLQVSCSPCAALVCSEDPFCCNTKWDGLCAQRAELECNSCL